ncbi:hypothetical protein KSW81_008044 [Nannochloris sp. 'desiccata']|nr:hypothetical protein KSW81_008044 [Chlorella desiccata (nom. nud.)]
MALLPTTYPDQRRRKYQRKTTSWWQGKAGTFLLFAFCFLGYAGWRRGSRIVNALPSLNGSSSRGSSRRDLKEQIRNNVALSNLESSALGAPAPGLTTFPAQDDARRILVATHSKLAWYNYELDHFTIIHEGEGIYYGGFSGDQIDLAGVPETVWAISRPHNWKPTTSKEWLLEINIVTGEVQHREPIPSRFTHDTVRYGNRVYAADCGEGHILELEFPSMNVLRRMELFTLKEHVNTLSPTGNGTLWAMLHNLGPSILAEIDLDAGREIRRLPNIGDKSHGAVQWRGSIISLNSDNAALMKVNTETGRTEQLWQDNREKRYLKGLCVVDDVAFFGIAKAQERQRRDSGELNCEIGAYDLIEGVLLWRRQLPTEGLLNVLSAPHLQVESTSHAVWMSDPAESYRATDSYAKHLAAAKGTIPGKEGEEISALAAQRRATMKVRQGDQNIINKDDLSSLGKKTLLDLEPLETYDPLRKYPPLIGGRWASGYPRFDNSAKDKAHGLSSGAQLPLFRWNQVKLRDYLLGLPLSDWSEEAARKSNAWLTGREGNLNQFKPGTHAIHLIFSDQKGDNVYEFPWYKERFATFLEPLVQQLLGTDVANIIRMQFALMPGNTHIKRHVDKGGYSATGHRIHLVVASSPMVEFDVCEHNVCVPLHVDEGLVFELNNRLEHYVNNNGSMPRIHLVVDIAESARTRTILKKGQLICRQKQPSMIPESATLSTMQSKKAGIVAVMADSTAAIDGPLTPNSSPAQSETKPQFSKTELIEYKHYCTTVSNLENQNLEALAKAQPLVIERAAIQRDAACEKWRNAKASKLQAKQLLDDLDKWNLGKLFPTGKRGAARQEAKRIECQQQLDYTLAAVNRAYMEFETAKTRLNDAESEQHSLRSRLSDLFLARCNQNALVERMFVQSLWNSDPILAPLRQEIQELERQAAVKCNDDGPYCKTYKVLTSSKEKIHHAMQDFRVTGVMDLFQFSGDPSRRNVILRRGALILEPKHKQSIQAANELLQLVAEEVCTARKLLPVLPFNDDLLIESARTGIFASILCPDFVGNTEGQVKAKQCMEMLVQLKREVLNCLQYAQRNITRDSNLPLLKQLRVEITAKREKMAGYRHSLLEAALKCL